MYHSWKRCLTDMHAYVCPYAYIPYNVEIDRHPLKMSACLAIWHVRSMSGRHGNLHALKRRVCFASLTDISCYWLGIYVVWFESRQTDRYRKMSVCLFVSSYTSAVIVCLSVWYITDMHWHNMAKCLLTQQTLPVYWHECVCIVVLIVHVWVFAIVVLSF